MDTNKQYSASPTVKVPRRRRAPKVVKPEDEILVDPIAELVRPVPKLWFPERVRLTEPGEPGSTDLYAIGRIHDLWTGVVVEAEREGERFPPRLLGGFLTHAQGIFLRINTAVLESLPLLAPKVE